MTLEDLKKQLTQEEYAFALDLMERNPNMPLSMIARLSKGQQVY